MVFGEAAAGAAAGAHALWNYNRDNYLFDRKMRAENEYKILEWRSTQAELWRDDIRDIIGLTEKKMDSYLIVATLQLGMSVGLFTEGRLEPGTPPWLMHFYMLTLGAAFMYLLMAVWLAMHASIVATCSSVRLLTQFVRLPVPTWDQVESMRTYASSYETLEAGHMLRVPFTGKPVKPSGTPEHAPPSSLTAEASSSSTAPGAARGQSVIDPWGLEKGNRELYELQESPAALRRHVDLARKAARQYQCYDAFARVAMSFGTNQLLMAIGYYCLGYVAVQDGAPWPACCIVCIMTAIAIALVHLDFSLTRKEQLLAQILNIAGPASASVVTCAWCLYGAEAQTLMLTLLPIAYASHGLWLLFALVACGLELQPNGSVLPLKFRAVLYLDVFGWLSKRAVGQPQQEAAPQMLHPKANGGYQALKREPSGESESAFQVQASQRDSADSTPMAQEEVSQLRNELRDDVRLWQSESVQRMMEDHEKVRIQQVLSRMESISLDAAKADSADEPNKPSSKKLLKLSSYTDFGTMVPYLFDPESGDTLAANDSEASADGGVTEKVVPRSISNVEDDVERYCANKSIFQQKGEASQARTSDSESDFLGSLDTTVKAAKFALNVLGEDSADEEDKDQADHSASSSACRGLNPAGQVHESPANIFHPDSYVPKETKVARNQSDEVDIVTGHDKVHPGKLPAKIFRLGTLLLAALWGVGVALPFGVFREFMTKPLTADVFVEEMGPDGHRIETEVRAAVGTAPDGLPSLIPQYNLRENLPSLPEGELVNVDWPEHAGFVPRALSSDPTGTMFVVADDLGVYAGRLGSAAGAPVVAASAMPPALRRLQQAPELKRTQSVSFEHVPPCAALEGQALKDIGIVCTTGSLDDCRVVVLHARGRKLAECPLPAGFGVPSAGLAESRTLVDGADEVNAFEVQPSSIVPPAPTWRISNDWLHSSESRNLRETVNSVAVNNECLEVAEGKEEQVAVSGAFLPIDVGCVVVGTTTGRIVQLRAAYSGERRLVPERAMEQRPRGVVPGSLHVLSSGFVVALRHSSGTVQAFDSKLGTAVSEWRLPKDIQWLTLCGSGDSLFVLGLRNGTSVELHRFPLPAALKGSGQLNRQLHRTDRTWRLQSALPGEVGAVARIHEM
mmetsp:Transcript_25442/g.64694  ORF Transcript_25442/g.64694 Transcript_25442/m.64694 type:complete len:1136 (-) Transcript_25442:188-3595(-)